MLMALSLAEKLGKARGLVSCSLHPGVIGTNLGSHLDWDVEGLNLSKSVMDLKLKLIKCSNCNGNLQKLLTELWEIKRGGVTSSGNLPSKAQRRTSMLLFIRK